uniref:NADH-ubiquinone oxidoreductase chain 1 n=1 Tax=Terebratulina retusa TaxID=7580 RepID=Q9T9P0_9BILA|nr:NADH dehydrogenase subunit 1 [Terebratulina retusa]CAB59846.1 NADH dehydrogenase subunit 1 [Terebratulina retusa]
MPLFLTYSLLTIVPILVSVAFFTLMERKILSYSQTRKGPNKVSLTGAPQPLADALKLFTKELLKPSYSTGVLFLMAPTMGLALALIPWALYLSPHSSLQMSRGILLFLCISSLSVYVTLMAGWASNSKYALLGAVRGIAQTISYEVSMILILILPLILVQSFNIQAYTGSQKLYWLVLIAAPLALLWMTTSLAETNRAPFDFAEGESELVSGFNIEYGAATFALLFMAEYANILFLSFLTATLFLGASTPETPLTLGLPLWMKSAFIAFVFLWARATLPRLRYDLLMSMTWKSFLPVALTILAPLIALTFTLSP